MLVLNPRKNCYIFKYVQKGFSCRSRLHGISDRAEAEPLNAALVDLCQRWPINSHPKELRKALRILGAAAFDPALFECMVNECKLFAVYLHFSSSFLGEFFRMKKSKKFEDLTLLKLGETLNKARSEVLRCRREAIVKGTKEGLTFKYPARAK